MSLVSSKLAKKYKWRVEPSGLPSISARNGEGLVIDGLARVLLNVEGKQVPTAMYVSPDITGVILGIDWLGQPGNLWDLGGRRIKIGDGDWIPLSSHQGPACNWTVSTVIGPGDGQETAAGMSPHETDPMEKLINGLPEELPDEHRAGRQHENADGLSRRPESQDSEDCLLYTSPSPRD